MAIVDLIVRLGVRYTIETPASRTLAHATLRRLSPLPEEELPEEQGA